MGNYDMYVWPAYGLVFVVFLFNFIRLRMYRNRVTNHLKRLFQRPSS
ncbi:heme exporter protein CcmD [Legionella sp. W05-934-2]